MSNGKVMLYLGEHIIAALDEEAKCDGTSRSFIVSRLLATHYGLPHRQTIKQQIKDATPDQLAAIERILSGSAVGDTP